MFRKKQNSDFLDVITDGNEPEPLRNPPSSKSGSVGENKGWFSKLFTNEEDKTINKTNTVSTPTPASTPNVVSTDSLPMDVQWRTLHNADALAQHLRQSQNDESLKGSVGTDVGAAKSPESFSTRSSISSKPSRSFGFDIFRSSKPQSNPNSKNTIDNEVIDKGTSRLGPAIGGIFHDSDNLSSMDGLVFDGTRSYADSDGGSEEFFVSIDMPTNTPDSYSSKPKSSIDNQNKSQSTTDSLSNVKKDSVSESKPVSTKSSGFLSSGFLSTFKNPFTREDSTSRDQTDSSTPTPTVSTIVEPECLCIGSSIALKRSKRLQALLAQNTTDITALRKLCWGGIHPSDRATAWQHLLAYVPMQQSRKSVVLQRKRQEYHNHLAHDYSTYLDARGLPGPPYVIVSNNDRERSPEDAALLHQVRLDTPRTLPTHPFFHIPAIQNLMERVLLVWACRHPAAGYVQGMNDLLTPLIVAFIESALRGVFNIQALVHNHIHQHPDSSFNQSHEPSHHRKPSRTPISTPYSCPCVRCVTTSSSPYASLPPVNITQAHVSLFAHPLFSWLTYLNQLAGIALNRTCETPPILRSIPGDIYVCPLANSQHRALQKSQRANQRGRAGESRTRSSHDQNEDEDEETIVPSRAGYTHSNDNNLSNNTSVIHSANMDIHTSSNPSYRSPHPNSHHNHNPSHNPLSSLTPVQCLDALDVTMLPITTPTPHEADVALSLLLSPTLLFKLEADVYWCFTILIDKIQDNFVPSQPGIAQMVNRLQDIVQRVDQPLYNYIMCEHQIPFVQFAFRWFNCLLMREFHLRLIIRLLDTTLCAANNEEFTELYVYVSATAMVRWREEIMTMDFQDIVMFLQRLPTENWTEADLEVLISQAYVYQSLFKDSKHVSKSHNHNVQVKL